MRSFHQRFQAVGVVFCTINKSTIYGTGTLIHPNIVLTAAHVVKNATKITFYSSDGAKVSKVNGRAVVHKNYNNTVINTRFTEYDIALVFLDDPIPCEKYASLCSDEITEYEPYLYESIGFGNYLFKNERCQLKTPEMLSARKLNSKVVSKRKNLELISTTENVYKIPLFGTIRQGDSGGPLIKINSDLEICGIASRFHSIDKLLDNLHQTIIETAHHTYIQPHIPWILETIEKEL